MNIGRATEYSVGVNLLEIVREGCMVQSNEAPSAPAGVGFGRGYPPLHWVGSGAQKIFSILFVKILNFYAFWTL